MKIFLILLLSVVLMPALGYGSETATDPRAFNFYTVTECQNLVAFETRRYHDIDAIDTLPAQVKEVPKSKKQVKPEPINAAVKSTVKPITKPVIKPVIVKPKQIVKPVIKLN